MLYVATTIGLLVISSAVTFATPVTVQLFSETNLRSEQTFHRLTVETLPMSSEIARVEETGTPDYQSPFEIGFSGFTIPKEATITAAHLMLSHSLSYGSSETKTAEAVQADCPSGPCPFEGDSFWGAGAVSWMVVDEMGWIGPSGFAFDLLAGGYEDRLRSGALSLRGSVAGSFSSGDWAPSGFNSLSTWIIEGLVSGTVQASLFIEHETPIHSELSARHNPEPATFVLAGGAIAALAWLRRSHASKRNKIAEN